MNPIGPVYLMAGGGPGSRKKQLRYHDDLVRQIGKKKPQIAYVGAAAGDGIAFEKMITTMIFGLSANVVSVKLTKKSTKTSEAKSKLEDADIIFMSGGDVDAGMHVIQDRGLADFLKKLNAQGKAFEGVSAGSILLGEKWVRFHDDHKSPEVFDCLGIVPYSFDAHGEKDEWEELVTLAQLLPKKNGVWVCGLVSGHCAFWEGGQLHALGGPLQRFETGTAQLLPDLEVD